MKKSFQLAAVLVAAMLGACSGGEEKNAETAVTVIEKPTVKLASVSSRDVEQIAEYTATVEAEAKNNIAPTAPGRISKIFVEVGDQVRKGQKSVQKLCRLSTTITSRILKRQKLNSVRIRTN